MKILYFIEKTMTLVKIKTLKRIIPEMKIDPLLRIDQKAFTVVIYHYCNENSLLLQTFINIDKKLSVG